MSLVTLKNNLLSISIDTLGAELQSIKTADKTEYLWQGNKEFWGRKSPVLFPIVGKLNEDKYTYQSKEFTMNQHGFARDNEFLITKQTNNTITLTLDSKNLPLDNYPFKFILNITYTLINNSVKVHYSVENIDSKPIYFSIGAHPGFNVPLADNESKEDYYIEFSPYKVRNFIPVTKDVLLDINQSKESIVEDIPLSTSLFKNGVLVYETPGKNTISLRSRKQDKNISITYDNMPYLGIWSPYPKDSPFVCIEPWSGVADTKDFHGDISKKLGINKLEPSKLFDCSYAMTFN